MNIQIKKSYIIEVTEKELIWLKSVLDSIDFEQFEDIKLKDEFDRIFKDFELMK